MSTEIPSNHTYAADRSEWREWLSRHHEEREVWLIYFKKATGMTSIVYGEAVEEALCFGWIDGIRKRIDEQRFMQRFTPRQNRSTWSVYNCNLAEELIRKGLMTEVGLAKIEAAKKQGLYGVDRDVGLEEPSHAFVKALESSPEAKKNFLELPPSQRRRYCGWINTAKREDTKNRQIEKAVSMLMQNQRLEM